MSKVSNMTYREKCVPTPSSFTMIGCCPPRTKHMQVHVKSAALLLAIIKIELKEPSAG